MKIEKFQIENFRSIENIVLSASDLNVLVGSNNAGKSNILDAINLVLGESWPSAKAIEENDFRDLDASKEILIRVWFSEAETVKDVFGNAHEARGMYLKFGHYKRKTGKNLAGDLKVDFFVMKQDGAPLEIVQKRPPAGSKPFSEPCRISSDFREKIPMLMIGVNRNLDFQLRSSRYSLLGRILRQIEREFSKDSSRVKQFEEKIKEAAEHLRIDMFKDFEKKLSDRVLNQIGLKDLSLAFQPFDPLNHYKALDLQMRERTGGPVLSATSMGSGVQSAIVLALLQSYREVVQDSALLAIEEPELFMHPQACRYFYRILKDLSLHVQVFYTTHSAFFIDAKRFEDVIYVRKSAAGATTAVSGIGLKGTKADAIKLDRKFDSSRNELFFAKKVVLVEGADDKEALLHAFKLKGCDIDKEGISIVNCDCKNNMPAFTKIVNHFAIPSVAVFDEDKGKTTGEPLSQEIEKCLGTIGKCFVLAPDLEGIFGLSAKIFSFEWVEFLEKIMDFSKLPKVIQSAVNYIAT